MRDGTANYASPPPARPALMTYRRRVRRYTGRYMIVGHSYYAPSALHFRLIRRRDRRSLAIGSRETRPRKRARGQETSFVARDNRNFEADFRYVLAVQQ